MAENMYNTCTKEFIQVKPRKFSARNMLDQAKPRKFSAAKIFRVTVVQLVEMNRLIPNSSL